MLTTLLFLIVLAVLIFVHELGHFLSARYFGVRVDEFAIGFGPKIVSYKKNNIQYSLRLIPFGGYVKIYGEDIQDISKDSAEKEESKDLIPSGISFIEAKKWKQAIILFAGVLFNFIFAFILFSLSFYFGTIASTSSYDKYEDRIEKIGVFISSVNPGSPSDLSGIKPGDIIKGVSLDPTQKTNKSVSEVQDLILKSNGTPVYIDILRGEETLEIEVIPERGVVSGRDFAIGVNMDEVGIMKLPIHLAIYEGARFTLNVMYQTVVGFYDLISDSIKGDASLSSVTGPIGIANMVGDAYRLGLIYLMMFTALISVNLGIINLVPFPALDGGRLLIVFIESIIKRALAPKIVGIANTIGFFALMTLMLFVTWKDIINLF